MVEKRRNGIVITVFSTASAVGKTLISTNMAAKLAQERYAVCLIDFDLQFGDVCNYLQLRPERTIADAQKAVQRDVEQFDPLQYLTPYTAHPDAAFQVLASPLHLDEAYNITVEASRHLVTGLQPYFDYIVLDTTSAFSELNLALMDLSTIITFLGIVDFIPTIKNMKIGCDTMHSIGYENNKIRLVLNRSNSRTNIELPDVEQLLEEKFYHILPNDFAAASQSIKSGVPLVLADPPTELGNSLTELVDRYTNKVSEQEEKGGGLSLFRHIFKW